MYLCILMMGDGYKKQAVRAEVVEQALHQHLKYTWSCTWRGKV